MLYSTHPIKSETLASLPEVKILWQVIKHNNFNRILCCFTFSAELCDREKPEIHRRKREPKPWWEGPGISTVRKCHRQSSWQANPENYPVTGNG